VEDKKTHRTIQIHYDNIQIRFYDTDPYGIPSSLFHGMNDLVPTTTVDDLLCLRLNGTNNLKIFDLRQRIYNIYIVWVYFEVEEMCCNEAATCVPCNITSSVVKKRPSFIQWDVTTRCPRVPEPITLQV
jgi:hypothetical protein